MIVKRIHSAFNLNHHLPGVLSCLLRRYMMVVEEGAAADDGARALTRQERAHAIAEVIDTRRPEG